MKADTRSNEPNVAADALAGGASIDKVRDILFGVQMRDYDKRFARLEERLLKETSELKDDVKKRLAALEQFMKQEVECAGRAAVVPSAPAVSGAVKELGVSCDESPRRRSKRRRRPWTTSLAKAQRELRQQLLEQQQDSPKRCSSGTTSCSRRSAAMPASCGTRRRTARRWPASSPRWRCG